MTDYRIEGAAREGLGHLQDAAGGLIGDEEIQARGKLNEAGGAAQNAYGKAKDQVEHAVETVGDYAEDAIDELSVLVRDRPLTAVGLSIGAGFLLGLLVASSRR